MTGLPLVSVVVPAFNAERTIGRALRSALAQTYRPIEVVVVDDGSVDRTAAVVLEHRDPAVRLIRLPHSCGVGGASNIGVGAACGEFVALLDADDEWLPGKLTTQVAVLMTEPCPVFAFARTECIVDGVVSHVEPEHELPPIIDGITLWRAVLRRSFIIKSSIVVSRRHLIESGGFDESLVVAEDQDLFLRLARRGAAAFSPETLVRFHRDRNSLTGRMARDSDRYVLRVIRRELREHGGSFTAAERRDVLATRYAQQGRSLYISGAPLRGLMYGVRAFVLGASASETLLFPLVSSRLVGPAKRMFKRRLRATPSK